MNAKYWPCFGVKSGRESAAGFIVVLDSRGSGMNIRYRVDLSCVFRRKSAGDSDPFQPVIPTEASHWFRCIPATLRGSGGGTVREQSFTDGTVALH